MATETMYVVQSSSRHEGDNWRTDGIGENEPRSRADCEEFIQWATSSDCDWSRDGGAPHRYRLAEVDADGVIVRSLPDTERADGERAES